MGNHTGSTTEQSSDIHQKKFSSNSSFELILELGWTTLEIRYVAGMIFRLFSWLRMVPSFDQSGPEGTKSALKKWVRQSIKLGFTKASQKYHAPDKTDGWF